MECYAVVRKKEINSYADMEQVVELVSGNNEIHTKMQVVSYLCQKYREIYTCIHTYVCLCKKRKCMQNYVTNFLF